MDPEQEDGWASDDSADDVVGSEEALKKGVPEGRRVIRKKKKGNSPRETLYLKRREILREKETRDGEEEIGPLSVHEQVERLKQARESDGPLEDDWGDSRDRRRAGRWILFVVLLVAAPLVAVIVMVSLSGKGEDPANPASGGGGSMFDLPDGPGEAYDPTSPEAWFYGHSVEAFEDVVGLLEAVNEAEEPDDLSGLLRDAKRTLPEIKKSWTGEKASYFLDDPRSLSWQYGGAGDTGFMVLMGRMKSHERFRAYFVKTDEGLKLDWKATTAWSPIPVGDLVAQAPKQPTVVRCWLCKQPEFDMFEGHGSLYSWYQILDPGKEEFVWAYVPAGSPPDEKLKSLLNYGMVVMARKDEVRATVRLVKPTLGFRESEFEILELVTEDWVMP
jgi:hypothetical protein